MGEKILIPPPPATMRSTPQAIAREVVEQLSERFTSVEHTQQRILEALDRAESAMRLLFDKLAKLEQTVELHSRQIRALQEIPRLPVEVIRTPASKKKRRARKG